MITSSVAVFGPPFPDVIGDEQRTTPATSYGTQKAIGELLLSDYTRRGFLDGVAVRLPTICVRPGRPNLAASGFFSNIIREPLNGREAVLPVSDDVRHWFASPRAAVQFLVHAAALDGEAIGLPRALTMPGVSATVAMQIEALRRAAGDAAVSLIRREPDETIARIVDGWPRAFDTRRALALGFRAERDFDEIVRVYIDDELAASRGIANSPPWVPRRARARAEDAPCANGNCAQGHGPGPAARPPKPTSPIQPLSVMWGPSGSNGPGQPVRRGREAAPNRSSWVDFAGAGGVDSWGS